jgi:hypothetical protein
MSSAFVIVIPPRNRSGIYNLNLNFQELQAFNYLQMQLTVFLCIVITDQRTCFLSHCTGVAA